MEDTFMSRRSLFTSGVVLTTLALSTTGVVLITLALSTSPAQAQTTAVGPYYATPSWDQTLPCTTPASCPRFIVLSNFDSAAVLDRETGLVWERSPSTDTIPWSFASLRCNNRTVGNRMGWRIPTVQDLATLVDPEVASLPAGHPFSNVQTIFWSATSSNSNPDAAWVASFRGIVGVNVIGATGKSFPFAVWCVRGGQAVDAQ